MHGVDVEEIGSYHGHIPLSRPSSIFMNSPPAMERPPSQESDTSMPDSLFSKLSEAETFVTEPAGTSTDALALGVQSKSESTEDLPAFLFDLASHRTCKLKHPQLHRHHALSLMCHRRPPATSYRPHFSIHYSRLGGHLPAADPSRELGSLPEPSVCGV